MRVELGLVNRASLGSLSTGSPAGRLGRGGALWWRSDPTAPGMFYAGGDGSMYSQAMVNLHQLEEVLHWGVRESRHSG